MQPAKLVALCQDITRELARDPKGPQVAQLLARYAAEHADWRAWAMFDDGCYTRNLVHHEERYELLLLCWRAGQRTPIHNHEGQRCWMAVLDGEIQETQFGMPASRAAAPLELGAARRCTRSQVAFITDDIALHEIAATERGPAVSLHLYSKPFSTCQVYDRATGRVEVRQLGYYSVRGERALASGGVARGGRGC